MHDAPASNPLDFYAETVQYGGFTKPGQRSIDYIDTAPRQINVEISLVEYFERIKRFKADRWQRHLCDTLQDAAATRHLERWWGIIHVEGQAGKTSVISQCFPAWLLGHDPLFRFALAMYNISRAQNHSDVVIQIMNSREHRDIFTDQDGWLEKERPSKEKWKTRARRDLNDGQDSFNPVGLTSGLTGSGFDWLGIDDPYREAKEAFSAVIRESLQRFYDYTVMSRTGLHSCISGMFHRYAPEDLAGYLLDTGDFQYLRYATQYDGPYTHEATGQVFEDPIGREVGEYLMPERRPARYYDKPRKNNRVWLSMFQGRPSAEEGEMFNVGRLKMRPLEEREQRRREMIAMVRSYDQAVSEEEGRAYSVGILMGIDAAGRAVIFDGWRERVDTAKRMAKQKELGARDGFETIVTVPNDPGSAGTDVVYFVEQNLPGHTVIATETSGSKVTRAGNFSAAMNAGEVEMFEFEGYQEFKTEFRNFPLSDYQDCVDSGSDAYNTLFKIYTKGAIMKHFNPTQHLVSIEDFVRKFPSYAEGDTPTFRIPAAWTVYAAVKIGADDSRPSSAVIAARASLHSKLSETLFVVDEYKELKADPIQLFDWLDETLKRTCEASDDATIWLHPDSAKYAELINQKLARRVAIFQGDNEAGLAETNWYLLPEEAAHPFHPFQEASHIYWLCHPAQIAEPKAGARSGFYHTRQEMRTWTYDDKGKPTKAGGVLDCLRMIACQFRTYAEPLTREEERANLVRQFLPDAETVNGHGEPVTTKAGQRLLETAEYLADKALQEREFEDRPDGVNWWED